MKISLYTMILLLLLCAQSSNAAVDPHSSPCRSDLLYRPVIYAMWSQDEGKASYAKASGFIRIAVHPTWGQEFFANVQLMRKGPRCCRPLHLPKDAKTVTMLLERELKKHPDANPESLAKMLPIHRQVFQADKKIEDLLTEFHPAMGAKAHPC